MNKNYFIIKISYFLLLVLISPFAFGQSTQTYSNAGTYSFTVPCDVTSVTVSAWGAGGGGDNTRNRGGGGGAFAQSIVSVTPGSTYIINVGLGPVSGSGGNGGDSSFGTDVIAKGGNGGNGGTNSGRGGQASVSTGTIKSNGGNGGISSGDGGAGGGGSAGAGGAGGNGGDTNNNTGGILGLAGAALSSLYPGAAGGNGGNNNTSGVSGVSPGGGGGERGKAGSNSSGGGGNGRIEVTYASALLTYCTPSFNNAIEPITKVTFAGIDNSTNSLGASSLENFCITGSVIQGSATNSISVKGNTVGNYINYFKAYIDWDQNGVYGNVPNEIYDLGTISNSTGIDAKSAVANIVVPSTALLGDTRMRIIKTFSVNNSNNPCFSGSDYGQAEDYFITVVAPAPNVTSFSPNPACQGNTVTITGANFAGVSAVTVNNVAVSSFTVNSATSITAVLASGNTTGLVKVTTASGIGTSASNLTINPKPAVTNATTLSTCSGTGPNISLTASTPSSFAWTIGTITGSITGASAGSGSTINQTLTNSSNATAGTVQYLVTPTATAGTCAGAAFTITVTVNPKPALTNATTASICSGTGPNISLTASTPSSFAWTIGTVTGSIAGASAGSGSTINQTLTNPSNATAGTVQYLVTPTATAGTCAGAAFTITVTVNPKPSIPVFTKTDIDCINATGTITVTVQIAGETYSFDNGATFQASNIKSGLGVGSYNVLIKSGGCDSPATAAIVIADKSSTTWTTAGWSNGDPTSTKKIIFNGDYTFGTNLPASDLAGCSCEVLSGIISVPGGFTMTLTNELKVTGGSLTFENNASLVQENDLLNSGPITYKRTTPSLIETDYTYWSSPVLGQTLRISPEYDYGSMSSFDSTTNYWGPANLSTVMTFGVGYAIRGQRADNNAYTITSTFTGVPNNGTKPAPTGPTGNFVLLGNPYPSALSAEAFLDINSNEIEGTIFFWTHKTAIQAASGIDPTKAGSGTFAYTSDDYAAYNSVGGVAVGSGTGPNSDPLNLSLTPSGNIASGQAFFAISKGAGSVTFNNGMRVGSGGSLNNNAQFFRTKSNAKTKSTISKSRVWLNLTNTEGAFKQTLIGYVTNATNGYEDRYDGESFSKNKYVDFYSVNNNRNFVIQGRALPFDENDVVPLGYTTELVGTFSIGINDVDGLLKTQNIFLEDKLLNVIHDLKTASYSFTTQKGTFDDRFVLRYTNKTLGTGDFDAKVNAVVVSSQNKKINVNAFVETISKIEIFDLSSRRIYKKDKINSNAFSISDFSSIHQALIVKTTLENGKLVTTKIVF